MRCFHAPRLNAVAHGNLKRKGKTMFQYYKTGERFLATIKTIRPEGVYIEMPDGGGGSGTISPRCWGDGIGRREALTALRPGETLAVIVKKFHAPTRTLSLLLDNADGEAEVCRMSVSARKPEFEPVSKGTVFLWDLSNFLAIVGAAGAARKIETISQAMAEQGYTALFFLEQRAFTWAKYNQASTAEVEALKAVIHRDDVSVVPDGGDGHNEADCALLQVAEVIPGSVCVSWDHYYDYARAHPAIVATSRIRPFSFIKHDGKLIVSVQGLTEAIVIDEAIRQGNDEEVGMATGGTSEDHVMPVAKTDFTVSSSGLFAVADKYIRRGDARNAERVLAKVAKKDPAAYDVLAAMYGGAVSIDSKKAARYERLARDSVKFRKERDVRCRRRRAEAFRCGQYSVPHFSAKCRMRLGLSEFKDGHDMVRDFWRSKRGGGHAHNCAA